MTWKRIYYSRAVDELGPTYHCLTCRRAEKNLADGCPKCALTETFDDFRDQVIDELTRGLMPELTGSGVWPLKRYSFHYLLELNSFICQLLNEGDELVAPEADLFTVELAEIVIAERRRAEKIDHYNARRQK